MIKSKNTNRQISCERANAQWNKFPHATEQKYCSENKIPDLARLFRCWSVLCLLDTLQHFFFILQGMATMIYARVPRTSMWDIQQILFRFYLHYHFHRSEVLWIWKWVVRRVCIFLNSNLFLFQTIWKIYVISTALNLSFFYCEYFVSILFHRWKYHLPLQL